LIFEHTPRYTTTEIDPSCCVVLQTEARSLPVHVTLHVSMFFQILHDVLSRLAAAWATPTTTISSPHRHRDLITGVLRVTRARRGDQAADCTPLMVYMAVIHNSASTYVDSSACPNAAPSRSDESSPVRLSAWRRSCNHGKATKRRHPSARCST
jgi:hypothetical protein